MCGSLTAFTLRRLGWGCAPSSAAMLHRLSRASGLWPSSLLVWAWPVGVSAGIVVDMSSIVDMSWWLSPPSWLVTSGGHVLERPSWLVTSSSAGLLLFGPGSVTTEARPASFQWVGAVG